MRLELLIGLVEAPIIESRELVPGDIFSHRTYNGHLRPIDEDRLLTFDLYGPQNGLDIMVEFEARCLRLCACWKTLDKVVEDRMSFMDRRPTGWRVQSFLLHNIIQEIPFWSLYQTELLDSVERQLYKLVGRRPPPGSRDSIGYWLSQMAYGCNVMTDERIKSSKLVGVDDRLLQWTATRPSQNGDRQLTSMLGSLVMYAATLAGPAPGKVLGAINKLGQIFDQWDVWSAVKGTVEEWAIAGHQHYTTLFVRLSSACTMLNEEPQRRTRSSTRGTCRLIHYIGSEAVARLHVPKDLVFLGHVDTSLDFRTIGLVASDIFYLGGPRRLQPQVTDTLIDDVGRSTKLDQDCKDRMIEDLRAL